MSDTEDVVQATCEGKIAIVTLNRPHKHNALSETVFEALRDAFASLGPDIRVAVLHGAGPSFCAGLDLAEHQHREPFDSVLFGRRVGKIFEAMQSGGRVLITALSGAVIGGGLEMAACAHIRVADTTTFYQLPEARRGIFVGGGASIRVRRIIGVDRLVEMMLTGRRFDADEGQRLGLSHHLVEKGKSLEKALELAAIAAENPIMSNYMITEALPLIGEMPDAAGFFTEGLAQALTLTSPAAQSGIEAFLTRAKGSKPT